MTLSFCVNITAHLYSFIILYHPFLFVNGDGVGWGGGVSEQQTRHRDTSH